MTKNPTEHNINLTESINRLANVLQQQSSHKLLIDIVGVASLLNIGETSARRLNINGKLPRPIEFGKIKRWRVAEIKDWIRAGAPRRTKWARSQKTYIN